MDPFILATNKQARLGQLTTNYEIGQMLKAQKYEEKMFNFRSRLKYKKFFTKLMQIEKENQVEMDSKMMKRRNEKLDLLEARKIETKLGFKYIENILFTKNEIDIEKITILHVVAAQKHSDILALQDQSSNLSPSVVTTPRTSLAPRSGSKSVRLNLAHFQSKKRYENKSEADELSSRKSSYTATNQTKRMKRKCATAKWLSSFPIYILEMKQQGSCNHPIDGTTPSDHDFLKQVIAMSLKITRKLVVNIKIIELLNTIMDTLEQYHPAKFKEVHHLSKNIESIKKLLLSSKSHDFVKLLSSKAFITSPDSFKIIETELVPISIDVEPSSELEALILKIREHNSPFYKPSKSYCRVPSGVDLTPSGFVEENFNWKLETLPSLKASHDLNIDKYSHILKDYISKKINEKQYKKSVAKTHISETSIKQSEHELQTLEVNTDVKPFTILQSKCVACLNKYKLNQVEPKIPNRKITLTYSSYTGLQDNCVFNRDVSHYKTNTLNHLISSAIKKTKWQGQDETLVCCDPVQSVNYLDGNNEFNFGRISRDSSSYRNMDKNIMKAVFNDDAMRQLSEEIGKREMDQRLKNFLKTN